MAVIALSAVAAMTSSTAAREQSASVVLLDVPYIPQTEALCGGAAAAMVLRFWGATAVYAESFSDLVQPSAEGIRADDLVRAIQMRGWRAVPFTGDAELVRSHLLKRRPVVALIEDRPNRFHYVVIVAWPPGRVVLHDPARAPFRVLRDDAFRTAWQRANLWAMLVLPPEEGAESGTVGMAPSNSAATSDVTGAGEEGACGGMVREGVRLAADGAFEDSRQILEAAIDTCPGAAGPWRELAGIRALKGEWADAGANAREALRRDPHDRHAWRILATSRFLEGDADGALDAWNQLDEPILDLVNIAGLDRTRYRVASEMLRLSPNAVLRLADLTAARRRLAELPSAFATRAAFVPAENGRARIDASVVERPVAPLGALPFAVIALRSATDRELRVPFASATGGGEVLEVQWRWWERRPRVALTFTAPAPRRLGTTWSIEAYRERQTYKVSGTNAAETERGLLFRVADWPTGTLRWHGEISLTRWTSERTAVGIEAGVSGHLFGDRLIGDFSAAALAGDPRTWTGRARAGWRSTTKSEGTVWLARAGYDAAGADSPLALWPGAGTGQGRDVLLRAHRLLDDGIVDGGVFGKRLIHGGVEARRWFALQRKPLRVAPAVFIDAARARQGIDSSDHRAHVDAGAGVRVAVPGTGLLRVDLARGLRDGNTILSFGWTR